MTYLGVRTATSAKADLTRTVGGGGGGPAGVAGCTSWWDPSVTASVISSAGKVSQVTAQVGAYNLTQATGANQPGLVTVNSLQALNLDGTNDGLTHAAIPLAMPFTLFLVVNGSGGGQGDYHRPWQAVGTNGPIIYSLSLAWTYAASASVNAGSAVGITAQMSVLSVVFNGASSAFFRNGVAGTAGNTGAWSATAQMMLGNDDTNAYGWLGAIGDCLIYNGVALTTPNRQAVENYLRTKWGAP